MTDRELETRLEVDVVRNLNNAPGVRVWRAGTNNSGVSNNNRMLERHTSRYGAYWKSYDFAGSVGTQNIFNHPLDFTHDGGEAIFNLPNGLQGYYLVNASGSRLDGAPINIVSNPAASDPTVRNGLSCFGCHTEGIKTFEDQVRSVIESNTNPAYDKAQALRLYVEQSEMDARLQEDMDRYRMALAATGGAIGGIEPISRFHEAFQGTVDAAHAAAIVGLETKVFLEKIRENVGLQNAGLLVLDSANGSMKRDAWTSSFADIVFALDFPERFTPPTVITPPKPIPGKVVRIPDLNLRAAIAEALGKSPNAPITVEEMEGLDDLGRRYVGSKGIRDLTGLQFVTNLEWLDLQDNQISDISPLVGLINLRTLILNNNLVSDISPLKGLKNLDYLKLRGNQVSDISPIAGLINLEILEIEHNEISDISALTGLINLRNLNLSDNLFSDLSPIAGLINLERIAFSNKRISDISALAGLINLKAMTTWSNPISDISPLAGLTQLEKIDMCHADIKDIFPLTGLTRLTELYFVANEISDISPLAGLTELSRLNLNDNEISDISPLAGLTDLKWLNVAKNEIANFSPLDGLRENIKLVWHGNPGFPTHAPKIEGPWLWVVLPGTVGEVLDSTDLLSEVSGGTVTEVEIATHGAIEGGSVGSSVWTSHKLPPAGGNNIEDMLKRSISDGAIYGTVSLYSPREQNTTMYVGGGRGVRVWLNGTLIYERLNRQWTDNYTDFFPFTLQQGRNVLLVAVHTKGNGFFGFEPGTEYTVSMGVGYAFSKTPIHLGDTFTLDIRAENVFDLAGWQFDIAFNPSILEAINVSEGDFLKMDGGTTFFQGGRIDNASGKITGLNAARLSDRGVTGTGTLLQVRFKAKSGGETELSLQNFQFGAITGEAISAGPHEIRIVVEGQLASGDVNRDGVVSILDLILVARQLGKRVPANSPVDVNGDGVVSILDLILVSQGIGNTTASAAPAIGEKSVDAATIEAWIVQAQLEDDGSIAFRQGIENLQNLLASLIPDETALHRNYPNPFNPETWIPYQLAEPAEVTLIIYDMNGQMVRRLAVGHRAAGMYRSRSRAVYWDGRNQLGESVASGLYFYTLTAGDFTATRRMLILK